MSDRDDIFTYLGNRKWRIEATAAEIAHLEAETEHERQRIRGMLPEPEPLYDIDGVRAWDLLDLRYRPRPVWLIEQVVEEKGLTVFFGPDKAGKTAVLSSFLWAWVAGKQKAFLDQTFKLNDPPRREGDEPGDPPRKVLYLLLEGQASYFERFEAWKYGTGHGDAEMEGFLVVDTGVQLFTPGFTAKDRNTWNADLRAVTQIIEDFRPHILVVDTFSRATAGIDENSSQVAQVVAWFDLMRDEVGCGTVAVHHTALDKQSSARPRGHSSLKGAASSYVRIEQNEESGPRRLVVGPHRNAEAVNPSHGQTYGYYFEMQQFRNSFVVGQREAPSVWNKTEPATDKLAVYAGYTAKDVAELTGKAASTIRKWVSADDRYDLVDGKVTRVDEMEYPEEL